MIEDTAPARRMRGPPHLGRIPPRRPELSMSERSGSGNGCGPGGDPFHGNFSVVSEIPCTSTHPGHRGGIPTMRPATVLADPHVSRRDCRCSAHRPVGREERAPGHVFRDRSALATSPAMTRSEGLSVCGRCSTSSEWQWRCESRRQLAGHSVCCCSWIPTVGPWDRQCDLLFLRTTGELGSGIEDCPFCGTTIRPGAVVCTACGAFKDKRMGCAGCLALLGAVLFSIGVLFVVALFPESIEQDAMGVFVIAGLFYAGLAALCFWAVATKRRLKWYRRM